MNNHSILGMSAKSVLLYRIRIIIIASIIAFFCGVLMAFFTLFSFILSIAISFLIAISFFWYPALLYKNYSVAITADMLCVTKGVIFLRDYHTNITNICYVGKITTPLQRFFGIFSLCLYTRSGKIYLSNLEAVPSALKDFINE